MNKEYFNTKDIKGRYQQTVASETAKALMLFCEHIRPVADSLFGGEMK